MKYTIIILAIDIMVSILSAYLSDGKKWYLQIWSYLIVLFSCVFVPTLFTKYVFPEPLRCGNPILGYLFFNFFIGVCISTITFLSTSIFLKEKNKQ